jgi:hypothetical protein
VNEEGELRIHLLQEELTQILEAIHRKHNDLMSMEQVGEYLGLLIESLKFFHERGDYARMEYDLSYAIAFLPSAFPI